MTSGVSMNDLPGGARILPTCSLTMAAQPLDAGDQITGCGPLFAGSGQPLTSSCAAPPLDTFFGRTKTHFPSTLFFLSLLNVFESSVSTATFSGLVAMSTVMQSPASPL